MVFNMLFGMLLNNFKKKGGDNMITYSTLFEFCKLIVAIIPDSGERYLSVW